MDEMEETEFKEYEKLRDKIHVLKEKKFSKEERRKAAEEFAKEDTSNIFRKLDAD